MIDAELLQLAFAGLIADRAVERVIDQEKFHDAGRHSFTSGESVRTHAFGHMVCAQPITGRGIQLMIGLPSCPSSGFRSGPEPRKSHFDQTHPAIARGAELF